MPEPAIGQDGWRCAVTDPPDTDRMVEAVRVKGDWVTATYRRFWLQVYTGRKIKVTAWRELNDA